MAQREKDKNPLQPQRVGVREFRGNLSGFLRQARLGGSFLIMSHDQVLAEVRPPPIPQRLRRQPGALRGKIRMALDFDALPPGVLAAMEGEEG
jgi:antitoxin (DNA-binding transcriptional repressor) of toxin-antitoxin stability system